MTKTGRNRIIGVTVLAYAGMAFYLSTTPIWHSWVKDAFLAAAPLAAFLLIATGRKPNA